MSPTRTDAEILAVTPPALRDDLQHSLNMVRLQAQVMDTILAAFDRAMATPASDPVETCQRCGRKGTPPCACSTPDRPPEYPDTAWSQR